MFRSVRPLDLDVHLQSFSIPHFPSLMISMSKPAYLAVLEYSPTKPVIVFVSSRKQCRLTADDIIAHCGSDEDSKRFLNIEEEDLQPHLDHITDKGLVETLKYGIGYFHEALDKQDKRIVERLFKAGAIQVMIASRVRFHTFSTLIRTSYIIGNCLEPARRELYGNYHGRSILRRQGAQIRRLSRHGGSPDDGPSLPTPRG